MSTQRTSPRPRSPPPPLSPSSLTLTKLTHPLTPTPSTPPTTPSTLHSELTHYRALFSALRFNYLEQVTKEKFLRGIVEDPSLVVASEENASLTLTVLSKKSALQDSKREVARLLAELEDTGRRVVELYQAWEAARGVVGVLPGEIVGMEEEIGGLGEVGVGLGEVRGEMEGVREEREGLGRRVRGVEEELAGRRREVDRVDREVEGAVRVVGGLEGAVREAVGERERREREGRGGEGAGVWFRGSWEVLNALVGEEEGDGEVV